MTDPSGRVTTGVLGLLGLAPPGEESDILPHEQTLPKPKSDGKTMKGVVLRIDHFGNLVTNFTAENSPALFEADAKFTLRVGNGTVTKLVPTFAQGASGEAVAIVGSSGYLEVCVNRANAARTLGAARGAEVTVELA